MSGVRNLGVGTLLTLPNVNGWQSWSLVRSVPLTPTQGVAWSLATEGGRRLRSRVLRDGPLCCRLLQQVVSAGPESVLRCPPGTHASRLYAVRVQPRSVRAPVSTFKVWPAQFLRPGLLVVDGDKWEEKNLAVLFAWSHESEDC